MLNFLFPQECLICSKVGSLLCEKCKKNLQPTLPICYKCRTLSNNYLTHEICKTGSSLEKIVTFWKYNEYSKKLIHNFKYKNRFRVADYIFSLFEHKLKNINNSLIIPLPSHKKKVLERGFNPTEILSDLISKKLVIDINNKLILKKKENESQARLLYDKRVENVKNIFQIDTNEIENLNRYEEIIIVDDIITTGATLNEICLEIRKYSEIKVSSICIFQGNFKKKKHEY